MTAADTEPTLSSDDLDALLLQFQKNDAAAVAPNNALWVPTYRLRAAAAEGWRIKMGRASEAISTDLDGDRMSANQLFDHCERMVKLYARSSDSVVVAGQLALSG